MTKPIYFQLKISLPDYLREPVTAVLYDLGCEGIEEKDDALIAYFPESANPDEIKTALLSSFPPRPAIVSSLLPSPPAGEGGPAGAPASAGRTGGWGLGEGMGERLTISYEAVEEKDWQAAWKERFECVRAAGFLICPPWKIQEPNPGEKLLLLDPGNAFGAGDHVTTLTVLKFLKKWAYRQENLKESLKDKSLLDLGTGTGILAIGACLLGVGSVTAVDTDASSVEAAENNFALNRLTGKARIIHGDLRSAGTGYDIVLANIFLEPLLELMHSISAVLNPGGTLIISGLLEGQERAVLAEADREGLLIVDSEIVNGWFSGMLVLL